LVSGGDINKMEQKRDDIFLSRRRFLKMAGTTCVSLLITESLLSFPSSSSAAPEKTKKNEVAEGENINETLKRLFASRKIEMEHVDLKVPIIAENGAVVPITVISDLPMDKDNYVKKIYILVEGNLKPHIATIDLTPANGKAEFAMRVKMRKSSNVRAVLETNSGKLYSDIKPVKVTIGGCGGL
jgi:sulfur-oxidizing protein SoxY